MQPSSTALQETEKTINHNYCGQKPSNVVHANFTMLYALYTFCKAPYKAYSWLEYEQLREEIFGRTSSSRNLLNAIYLSYTFQRHYMKHSLWPSTRSGGFPTHNKTSGNGVCFETIIETRSRIWVQSDVITPPLSGV